MEPDSSPQCKFFWMQSVCEIKKSDSKCEDVVIQNTLNLPVLTSTVLDTVTADGANSTMGMVKSYFITPGTASPLSYVLKVLRAGPGVTLQSTTLFFC